MIFKMKRGFFETFVNCTKLQFYPFDISFSIVDPSPIVHLIFFRFKQKEENFKSDLSLKEMEMNKLKQR